MEDLVSIIIPIYNVEKYLDECIKSVLNQTYHNLEIILIDDGSTDSSKIICEKYKNIDNRIQLITKKNGGLASARNLGIDMAKGNYIYFLDSDDYIKKSTIEEVIDYMKINNADLCYFSGDLLLEFDNLGWNERMYKKEKEYKSGSGISVMKELVYNNEYTCQNCMFMSKTSLLNKNKIRYTEGYIYEDNYFAFLLGMYSKISCVYNKSLYVRRVREGSIMTEPAILKKRIISYKVVLDDFNSIKNKDKDINDLLKHFKRGFVFTIVKYCEELNDKMIEKEIKKYFRSKKYFKDLKLLGYLKLREVCKLLNINDPVNLIK